MNNFDLNYVRHLINGIVSLIKSLELSSSNSKVYAYSLFQLISLFARTNRVALA